VGPSPSQPEFFLDRSLGGHDVARALRRAGWNVHTHLEVYRERDQQVEDVEWLELCGRNGWPAITMDRRIRYRPAEHAALREHGVRAFVLSSGNLTATDQARRLDTNRGRIEIACTEPGPFLYAVHAGQIVKVFPA